LESLTDSLMERVAKLVPANRPVEWGSPHLSTTPTSLAIVELAQRTEALENAVREIAQEVQELREQIRSPARA
jgi:DNA-directed RNA polymerase subunit L